MQIWLKRAYERPGPQDGTRVLVDRIWPRGIRKDESGIDVWLKEIAPSEELRKWFGHNPERWEKFKQRYRRELINHKQDALERLEEIADKGRVTLVYGSKNKELNNAVVLKETLEE